MKNKGIPSLERTAHWVQVSQLLTKVDPSPARPHPESSFHLSRESPPLECKARWRPGVYLLGQPDKVEKEEEDNQHWEPE